MLLSLALAGAVAASVTELTKDTFHDFIKQKDLALVECEPSPVWIAALLMHCSLRSVVRPLQSTSSRVRGGCQNPHRQGHPSGQG